MTFYGVEGQFFPILFISEGRNVFLNTFFALPTFFNLSFIVDVTFLSFINRTILKSTLEGISDEIYGRE